MKIEFKLGLEGNTAASSELRLALSWHLSSTNLGQGTKIPQAMGQNNQKTKTKKMGLESIVGTQ